MDKNKFNSNHNFQNGVEFLPDWPLFDFSLREVITVVAIITINNLAV